MATATSKLEILIDAKTSGASSGIKQVEADLGTLNNTAATLADGLSGLATAAGVAGFFALGSQAVQTAASLSDEAASLRRVQVAAVSMAGSQSKLNDLLYTYQDAIGGAVAKGDALAQVAALQSVGFADSASELDQFVRAARGAALATGQDIGYVVDQLKLAIGNQSTMRLDQLGLGIDEVKTRIEQLKNSSTGLTDAQIYQQAIVGSLNEKYGDLSKAAETGATGVEKLRVSLKNAREEMAQGVSGGIDKAAQMLASGVDAFMKEAESSRAKSVLSWYEPLYEGILKTISAQQAELATLDKNSDAYLRLQGEIAKNVAFANQYSTVIGDVSGKNQRAAAESGELEGAFKRLGAAGDTATGGIQKVAEMASWAVGQLAALTAQSDAARSALAGIQSSAVGALQSAAAAAVPVLGAQKVSQMYDERKKKLNEQIEILTKYGYTTDEATFKSLELEKAAAEPFTTAVEAARAAEQASKDYGTSLSNVASQSSQAFDDLKSQVSGILSGALDPGVGVDPSSLLPRPDAINEDARRLADVAVNGWASPWADYFKTEFPDLFKQMTQGGDIKTAAAQMLQDFQDGLEPQLIDKDKVKDRVRRMLLGDQNMADLATEIATELSQEMGVPMQQALAAAQGTLGGGGGMGTETANQFADGAAAALDAADGGGTFVNKFTDQMRAKYSLLTVAGTDAAKMWSDAFLAKVGDSVPPALIDMLTTLITPQVVARLAQRQTLTGAVP